MRSVSRPPNARARTLVIDATYVRARVEDLAKDQDLSRFIL